MLIEGTSHTSLDATAVHLNTGAELYLNLLKKVLVNWTYGENECDSRPPRTRWRLPIWLPAKAGNSA